MGQHLGLSVDGCCTPVSAIGGGLGQLGRGLSHKRKATQGQDSSEERNALREYVHLCEIMNLQ